ncbi:hypothetical protein DSO57_1016617 [Entomophthora muscae]|uniref:Uncharacterized protein n=1 Tax=Entomophthora muscae TaxID=34485 RepID=A0ACC2T541_9FUNG|nr:hypothetical protein DSO57_1016617 [Entomophthora muscae]
MKAKVKSSILKDNKINNLLAKTLMTKMLNTSEKPIECLPNVQKTLVEGLHFKVYILSAPSVWANDPEMYENHKPTKRAHKENTEMPAQLVGLKIAQIANTAGKKWVIIC